MGLFELSVHRDRSPYAVPRPNGNNHESEHFVGKFFVRHLALPRWHSCDIVVAARRRSAAGLRQETFVDEIGFGGWLVDDADIDERLLQGGEVLFVDMPVGEEARRL